MAVLLYSNRTKDDKLTVTKRAARLLHDLGVPLLALPDLQTDMGKLPMEFLPQDEAFAKADLVLTVGGDGTLLQAAPFCLTAGKPVLGVNLGRTGFLATCEVSELPEKLARLAAGNFTVASRSLLHAETQDRQWQKIAMNDIVLFGTSRLHPSDFTVYCDEVPVSRFRGDGLIVATPTGSTAYSFSAGGPILDADASVMVLTPICAHGVRSAPIVFAATRKLRILVEEQNRSSATVCADSQAPCLLSPGASIRIYTAPQKLGLIEFSHAEQFRAIETKLMRR